jgi:hypothetical protein
VLIIANTSSTFEIFFVNICVIKRRIPTNTTKYSNEKTPMLEVIRKNQNESPAVTARDLNRGVDVCMLYRIDECH